MTQSLSNIFLELGNSCRRVSIKSKIQHAVELVGDGDLLSTSLTQPDSLDINRILIFEPTIVDRLSIKVLSSIMIGHLESLCVAAKNISINHPYQLLLDSQQKIGRLASQSEELPLGIP